MAIDPPAARVAVPAPRASTFVSASTPNVESFPLSVITSEEAETDFTLPVAVVADAAVPADAAAGTDRISVATIAPFASRYITITPLPVLTTLVSLMPGAPFVWASRVARPAPGAPTTVLASTLNFISLSATLTVNEESETATAVPLASLVWDDSWGTPTDHARKTARIGIPRSFTRPIPPPPLTVVT